MRCLILGATGLIGSHLASACSARRHAWLGTGYRAPQPDLAPLDLRDEEAVHDLIADYQPDVTFLAGGGSCPWFAERQPTECREVIVDGTANVAQAVARHGGSLVMFSADTVFGDSLTARREDAALAPHGTLAEDKVAAEELVRDRLPDRHLILRTGWVFGAGDRGRGTAGRIVRKLCAGEPVRASADRHGQPTYAGDLASAAVELAKRGHVGTVHVVGPDRHTEFTFARLVAHVLGVDSDLVQSVRGRIGMADPARPARVWLDRSQMRALLGSRAVRSCAEGLRTLRSSVFVAEPMLARAA